MKTLYVIIACVVVAGLVGSGLWFGVVTPTQKKLAVVKNESALCDSLATVNDSINAELQAKVTKAQDNAGYWEDRNDEKIAELDTIRPKALIADSLAAVVATLQAENAALAAAKQNRPVNQLRPLPPPRLPKPQKVILQSTMSQRRSHMWRRTRPLLPSCVRKDSLW